MSQEREPPSGAQADLLAFLFPDARRFQESRNRIVMLLKEAVSAIDAEQATGNHSVIRAGALARAALLTLEQRPLLAISKPHEQEERDAASAAARYLEAAGAKTPPGSAQDEAVLFIDAIASHLEWLGVFYEEHKEKYGSTALDGVAESAVKKCTKIWGEMPLFRSRHGLRDREPNETALLVDVRRLLGRYDFLDHEKIASWPSLGGRFLTAVLRASGVETKKADSLLPRKKRARRARSATSQEMQNGSAKTNKHQTRGRP